MRLATTILVHRLWIFAAFPLAVLALSPLHAAGPKAPGAGTPNSDTALLEYASTLTFPTMPNDEVLRGQLAEITHAIERQSLPVADCAKVLGAKKFGDMFTQLGNLRSNMGEHEAAVEAYREALICEPRSGQIQGALTAELTTLGRFDEARTAAARGLALDPTDARVISVTARLDFLQQRWADATARFQQLALEESEVNGQVLYWRCFLWLSQRRAGVVKPKLPAVDMEIDEWPLPILQTLQGFKSEADLRQIVEEEDNDITRREQLAEALFYIGESRLAAGDAETAQRYFASVVNLKVLYFIEHQMALNELATLRANITANSR